MEVWFMQVEVIMKYSLRRQFRSPKEWNRARIKFPQILDFGRPRLLTEALIDYG